MEHLQDNLRTYSPLEPLTDEEMDFLEDTAQLMLKYPTILAMTANIVCHVRMAWIFRLSYYIITVVSMKAMFLKTDRMRIISKPAGHFL